MTTPTRSVTAPGRRRPSRAPPVVAPLATFLAAGLSACAPALDPLPLLPEPIPYADTLPIAEPGEQKEQQRLRRILVHAPNEMAEPLRVPEGEALNRTHFDDVVSSAWFERRMGYDPIRPARLARGPTSPAGAPAATGPLMVRDLKMEGATPGFTLQDEKGDIYIVKLDPADFIHSTSAADVIVSRLMWGAGYHVPENYLMVFDSARLVPDEGATVETREGERPMTPGDVTAEISKTRPLPDGRFSAIASRFVPGRPKGTTYLLGRRADDANDHYRHEHRRELRGLRVISSWVNNTDLKEGNTMDVYVAPGYLRHYVIDFGSALGSRADGPKHPMDGVEQPADFWSTVGRFLSLGFRGAGWEEQEWDIPHSSLGYLPSETFDPAGWNAWWENGAFYAMTAADAYWGAKIVGAFTDAHIRAAVEEGGLPEPWVEDTLVAKLATRRDILVRHWYGEVTPIEDPAVESTGSGPLALSFRDLGIDAGIWDDHETTYRWSFEHAALDREGSGRGAAGGPGRQRLEIAWEGGADGRALGGRAALATLRVQAERPGRDPLPALVWLRWTGRGYEVMGLEH